MRKWDLHQPAGPQLEVRITVGHALPILQIPHAWCATYVSSDWFLNNYSTNFAVSIQTQPVWLKPPVFLVV